MAAFNRIFLMGTLVRDPELRAGGNGESRTEFRLAVDESRRSRSGELIKKTLFIDVLVWGAQAESSHRYLTQGSHVLVEGRLTAEEWKTREGQDRVTYKVIASNVQFLDPPPPRLPLPDDFRADAGKSPAPDPTRTSPGDIPF